nr:hypothetical protein [bacterium]
NNYIILSDHGMGPRKYRWNLGKWLIDEKFMFVKTDDERKKESDFTKNRLRKQFYDNLKKEDTGSLKKILKRCAFELWLLKQNIPVLNKMKIPFMKRPVGAHNENLIIPGTNSPIDYNKSLAFHHIPNLGRVAGIYLNFMPMNPAAPIKSVSEYENIRNTLIEKLKKVSDEKTGNPIIKNVWKREELYSGAYTNELFDIIIEFNEDYTDFEDSKDFYKMENIRTLAEPVIYHREKGIFFAAGHCFNGKNVAVRIHDVYSILSYLLDLPVYKNVDSKLDKSLFNDNFNATHKYEIIDNEPEKGRKEHLLSEDELNYVKKNLNKLGYLKKK